MKSVMLALFLGGCAFLGGIVGGRFQSSTDLYADGENKPAVSPGESVRLGERFETVSRKISPAVVSVEALKPGKKGKSVDESGSGVLIRVPGQAGVFVITNNHVISQSQPQQITITLHDNRILHPVQVWSDPESDIGLLKLEDIESLVTAPLGDSEQVKVGQWVLAPSKISGCIRVASIKSKR